MRFFIFLSINLIFFSFLNPASAKDCLLAFEMKGHQAGSLIIHEQVKLCEATKSKVLLEVDHAATPTRSILISEKQYFAFVSGFKNTLANYTHLPPSNRSCRHKIAVKIDWEGLQKEFSTCEGDPNFSLVSKFSDLMRDIYEQPFED